MTFTHLIVTEVPFIGKTKRWRVDSKYGGTLGMVGWFGRWRKYGFHPAPDTVFEEVCMRELSDFIVQCTKEHKS
jgi:hypothetical protein